MSRGNRSGTTNTQSFGFCVLTADEGVGEARRTERVWDAATMRHLRLFPSPRGPVVVRQLFAADAADTKMPDVVDALLVAGEVGLMPDRRLDDTSAQLRAELRKRWDARG